MYNCVGIRQSFIIEVEVVAETDGVVRLVTRFPDKQLWVQVFWAKYWSSLWDKGKHAIIRTYEICETHALRNIKTYVFALEHNRLRHIWKKREPPFASKENSTRVGKNLWPVLLVHFYVRCSAFFFAYQIYMLPIWTPSETTDRNTCICLQQRTYSEAPTTIEASPESSLKLIAACRSSRSVSAHARSDFDFPGWWEEARCCQAFQRRGLWICAGFSPLFKRPSVNFLVDALISEMRIGFPLEYGDCWRAVGCL